MIALNNVDKAQSQFLNFENDENVYFIRQKIYFLFCNMKVPGHSEKVTTRHIISALTFGGTFLFMNI
jgi:hypothetical protein